MFESHINLYVRFCAGLIVKQSFYEDRPKLWTRFLMWLLDFVYPMTLENVRGDFFNNLSSKNSAGSALRTLVANELNSGFFFAKISSPHPLLTLLLSNPARCTLDLGFAAAVVGGRRLWRKICFSTIAAAATSSRPLPQRLQPCQASWGQNSHAKIGELCHVTSNCYPASLLNLDFASARQCHSRGADL